MLLLPYKVLMHHSKLSVVSCLLIIICTLYYLMSRTYVDSLDIKQIVIVKNQTYDSHVANPFKPALRIIPTISMWTKLFGRPAKIPHIVHQTWKNYSVPVMLEGWMRGWTHLNHNWEYWFWTDADMRQLIVNDYPQFLTLYDNYNKGVERADVFRYFVMHKHGGFYADLDVECLLPLDPITNIHECILTQEPLEHLLTYHTREPPLVSNAIIACRPNHPFFWSIISQLKHFSTKNNILFKTGPFMMTSVFQSYEQPNSTENQNIYLAAPEYFSPTFDNSGLKIYKKLCQKHPMKTFEESCKKLLNGSENEPCNFSYTNHHWAHLWAGDSYRALKSNLMFNATSLAN